MKLLTKISSVFLAFLVLLSTVSFTVEKHFCGDFLVDISYFGDADGCSDEKKSGCDAPEVIAKKGCCKDEIQQIEGQDELRQTSVDKIKIEQQQFLLVFTFSYNNLFKSFSKQIISNQYYSPPEVVNDLQVLHEVFII